MNHCSADSFYIFVYGNHVLLPARTKDSIIGAFYSIKWGRHKVGLNSPTDNSFVQLAFEIWQWSCKKDTTKKGPVTSKIMQKLTEGFCKFSSDLGELRFLVSCHLGFQVFWTSHDIDMKLGPVTKLDKRNTTTWKNVTMTSFRKIVASFLFLIYG